MLYDPADGAAFWTAIKAIPGYPANEAEYPIREMMFESGAVFQLPALLHRIGADAKQPVLVVMDTTPMQRAGENLKTLVMQVLKDGNWQAVEILLESDATGQIHTDMHHIESVK